MTDKNKKTPALSPRTPDERRRRINRLKKCIIGTILTLILVPLTGCVCLGVYALRLRSAISVLRDDLRMTQRNLDDTKAENERFASLLGMSGQNLYADDFEDEVPDIDVPAKQETENGQQRTMPHEDGKRRVYLTFDDGPGPYTNELLDVLQNYNVKATFFVIGRPQEQYAPVYQRIVEEGHTLGMHSYSHKYAQLYASKESFAEDFDQLQELLKKYTGSEARYYRFPGGSSNSVSRTNMKELASFLEEQDVVYFDWNVSSGDAAGGTLSSANIVNQVLSGIKAHSEAVVLLHDSASQRATLQAIPEILEKIGELENTEILPITKDTMIIQHLQNNK